MKRIVLLLTVAVVMAVMLVAGAGSAFAFAYTPVTGGPSQGNVTEQADSNCEANYVKQAARGVTAGGGPKTGETEIPEEGAPTNCDHFFQREGYIGKN